MTATKAAFPSAGFCKSKSLSFMLQELAEQGLENLSLTELPEEADLSWLDRTEQTVQRMFAARGGKSIPADAVELIRTIREERANDLPPRTLTPTEDTP